MRQQLTPPFIASLIITLLLAYNLPPTEVKAGPQSSASPALDAGNCNMRQAFITQDTNVPGGRASVLGQSDDPSRGPVFFAAPLNVNTDGTSRSYSADDPGGHAFALNNICNAMVGFCRGLDAAALKVRFDRLRNARDHDWPPSELADSKLSSSVIPRRPDGRVCPEVQIGAQRYLVSSTALSDQRVGNACSLDRYVDALTVPALVLQGGPNEFAKRGIRGSDAVVAWRPGLAAPVYAVAGDTGPPDRLGEGSIALNGALLGRTAEPANYLEVRKEYVVPKAYVLIFPGTRDPQKPRITLDLVEAAASEAFSAWGGGSTAGGVARLQACATVLDSR